MVPESYLVPMGTTLVTTSVVRFEFTLNTDHVKMLKSEQA